MHACMHALDPPCASMTLQAQAVALPSSSSVQCCTRNGMDDSSRVRPYAKRPSGALRTDGRQCVCIPASPTTGGREGTSVWDSATQAWTDILPAASSVGPSLRRDHPTATSTCILQHILGHTIVSCTALVVVCGMRRLPACLPHEHPQESRPASCSCMSMSTSPAALATPGRTYMQACMGLSLSTSTSCPPQLANIAMP